jgi:hypothetical protein
LNTKIVDLATLYHFQKGYIGFFLNGICKGGLPTLNASLLTFEQVFHAFPLKI